jgi:two-component system response regulator HydG
MTKAFERGQHRILIVDDDLEFGCTIAEGLEMRGWCAIAVGDGTRALQLLEMRLCDALVTDLRMPEIGGLQLLRFVRQLVPELPVIVMTAFSARDAALECVQRGAFHYLTKPFKLAELDSSLQRAFEARAARSTS